MGLIDAAFVRALHLFRRIRNSFAHEVSGASLESGSHADRIREIVAPFENFQEYDKIREVVFPSIGGNKSDLFAAAAIMIILLEEAIADAKELSTYHSPIAYIPEYWRTKKEKKS